MVQFAMQALLRAGLMEPSISFRNISTPEFSIVDREMTHNGTIRQFLYYDVDTVR